MYNLKKTRNRQCLFKVIQIIWDTNIYLTFAHTGAGTQRALSAAWQWDPVGYYQSVSALLSFLLGVVDSTSVR